LAFLIKGFRSHIEYAKTSLQIKARYQFGQLAYELID